MHQDSRVRKGGVAKSETARRFGVNRSTVSGATSIGSMARALLSPICQVIKKPLASSRKMICNGKRAGRVTRVIEKRRPFGGPPAIVSRIIGTPTRICNKEPYVRRGLTERMGFSKVIMLAIVAKRRGKAFRIGR